MPQPKENTASPVDALIADISIAMNEWSTEQAATIKQKVHARLDKHRDEVLMKLMGFSTDHWGKWEIDHCNGRSGGSPIGDFLKESQDQIIREWLGRIKMPTMTPAFKKAIEKELLDSYKNEIRRQVYSMAREKAEKDLKQLLDTTLEPTQLGAFLKMQSLITPT